jgi:hypothetical protein
MASTHTNIDAGTPPVPEPAGSLLVSLASLSPEALEATLANLALAFPGQNVLVATPDETPRLTGDATFGSLRILPYTPATAPTTSTWLLTAADYLNTFKLAQDHKATACLLLGTETQSLRPDDLRSLASTVLSSNCDLAVANYNLRPREGLVNSAILYPVTRALFNTGPRFPLAIDIGVSFRMAERLAATAQKFTATNVDDALLWPVAEAAAANCTITEVDIGTRTLPQPTEHDLNAVLAQVAGSLFAEVETKASFWQRSRGTQPSRPFNQLQPASDGPPDVAPMIQTFNLAYTNLHEIWSLVLPPNSLLGLKRLSVTPPENFHLPDALWARIIYDFILAYRLRTINRGHLLGALTPLYLAWVASHLILIGNGMPPEKHIEELAATFETDKPYFVSRWRWPDRFNP